MKVIRDFRCNHCDSVTEKFIDSLETQIKCPECGKTAFKVLSCPRVWLDGTDPNYPGAYDKWGRDREKRRIQHDKKNG